MSQSPTPTPTTHMSAHLLCTIATHTRTCSFATMFAAPWIFSPSHENLQTNDQGEQRRGESRGARKE
eukprot:906280-Rhodomonas_salina.2